MFIFYYIFIVNVSIEIMFWVYFFNLKCYKLYYLFKKDKNVYICIVINVL